VQWVVELKTRAACSKDDSETGNLKVKKLFKTRTTLHSSSLRGGSQTSGTSSSRVLAYNKSTHNSIELLTLITPCAHLRNNSIIALTIAETRVNVKVNRKGTYT